MPPADPVALPAASDRWPSAEGDRAHRAYPCVGPPTPPVACHRNSGPPFAAPPLARRAAPSPIVARSLTDAPPAAPTRPPNPRPQPQPPPPAPASQPQPPDPRPGSDLQPQPQAPAPASGLSGPAASPTPRQAPPPGSRTRRLSPRVAHPSAPHPSPSPHPADLRGPGGRKGASPRTAQLAWRRQDRPMGLAPAPRRDLEEAALGGLPNVRTAAREGATRPWPSSRLRPRSPGPGASRCPRPSRSARSR